MNKYFGWEHDDVNGHCKMFFPDTVHAPRLRKDDSMSRMFRVFIILSVLMCSAVIGIAVPTIAQAAPPSAPPAQDAPTSADMLLIVLNLFAILLNGVISGGWLALILDDIGAWKNWVPSSNTGRAVKQWGVVVLTALVAGALLYAQTYFIPREFVKLPLEAQFVIAAMVSYIASQFAHQRDVIFQYRQRAENQLFYQRIDALNGYRLVGRDDAPTTH